jgi:hypothetical protein
MGIVIGVVVAILLLLVLLYAWARRGAQKARAALDEIAAGRTARRRSGAQSYGIKSKGPAQLSGLGYLALFDDELVFVQAIAGNHVRAPIGDIVTVTTPRSFLGKAGGSELLAIEWRTDGKTDEVAFAVPELDAWVEALRALRAS